MFFFRAGGIAEILAASSLDFSRYPSGRLGYVLGLIALVGVESAILVIVCLRAGRIRAGWVGLDVVFCTAGLVASAVLSAPSGFLTWANFMYPFTIITSFGIGAGVRRLPAVIGMTTVLAAGYFLSALLAHHDPLWNVLPDSLTYYANVVVAWAVARHLLAGGRELDDNRAEAVSRATELARERERARHARMLHDRVLQTLETLARGRWLDDPDFRTHIAGEAAWLRALVEGADPGQERDLLTALQLLVHRNIGLGLRVELNSSQLRDTDRWWRDLPADVVDAVVDATQEALTNVAKHSGVTTAVLRASTDGTHLAVSVLDHGCGFEPGTAHRGIGLDRSIRARMAELGGEARIESAPGAGTYVELVLPLNGSPAA
jgi:signal transduction histidine kinase